MVLFLNNNSRGVAVVYMNRSREGVVVVFLNSSSRGVVVVLLNNSVPAYAEHAPENQPKHRDILPKRPLFAKQ